MISLDIDSDIRTVYGRRHTGKMAHLIELIKHNPLNERIMVVCSDKSTIDMLTKELDGQQVNVTFVELGSSSAQNDV